MTVRMVGPGSTSSRAEAPRKASQVSRGMTGLREGDREGSWSGRRAQARNAVQAPGKAAARASAPVRDQRAELSMYSTAARRVASSAEEPPRGGMALPVSTVASSASAPRAA